MGESVGWYVLFPGAIDNIITVAGQLYPPAHDFVILDFTLMSLVEHIGHRLLVSLQAEMSSS